MRPSLFRRPDMTGALVVMAESNGRTASAWYMTNERIERAELSLAIAGDDRTNVKTALSAV